ncbi:MAG: histone deacetylase [Candidatus Altiarchaeota archaeon]|nr:histone deacetylase [Candidatus Altiarchaeota archaeon]
MKTGLIYSDDFLKHRQVEKHPECPERVKNTVEYFQRTNLLDLLDVRKPQKAQVEDLTRVHSIEHVNYIRCLSESGQGKFSVIDSDTYVCHETYETALYAAGATMMAGEMVWTGELDNCFSLVRPPGHHASTNQATGFCYFDNLSVMIRHLQAKHKVKKVFLFDWDAHAPNGTMGTFYADPSVLNVSIHQDPHSFFPGQGFIEQIGEKAGRGYTINFPVPAGTADPDYLYFIDEFIMSRVRKFKPDLIAVAAGQDSHQSDLVSQLNVTDAGFVEMTKRMMQLADELCGGKLVLSLEGGYNLNTFPITNYAIMSALAGLKYGTPIKGNVMQSTKDLLSKLNDTLKSSTIWSDAPQYGEVDAEIGKKICPIHKKTG